jgi:hypothetical protein
MKRSVSVTDWCGLHIWYRLAMGSLVYEVNSNAASEVRGKRATMRSVSKARGKAIMDLDS